MPIHHEVNYQVPQLEVRNMKLEEIYLAYQRMKTRLGCVALRTMMKEWRQKIRKLTMTWESEAISPILLAPLIVVVMELMK